MKTVLFKPYFLIPLILVGLLVNGALLIGGLSLLAKIFAPEPAAKVVEPEPASTKSPLPAPTIAKVISTERPFRTSGNQIVTDTFNLRYDFRDNRLTVALDTDLGDPTGLSVSVSRSYWERGSDDEYPVDYFDESSTVGRWREPRTISLDHGAWNREIENRQKILAAGGEPFTVDRIADGIKIRFVVPINQDPPFEPLNANLTGNAVTQEEGYRIVESEVVIPYPIDATNVGQTRFADPLSLTNSTTYKASGEIPLVPEIDPVDPIAAMAAIQRLSPDKEFTVLETTKRGNTPWYRVKTSSGEGWISSTALLGKEILIVR